MSTKLGAHFRIENHPDRGFEDEFWDSTEPFSRKRVEHSTRNRRHSSAQTSPAKHKSFHAFRDRQLGLFPRLNSRGWEQNVNFAALLAQNEHKRLSSFWDPNLLWRAWPPESHTSSYFLEKGWSTKLWRFRPKIRIGRRAGQYRYVFAITDVLNITVDIIVPHDSSGNNRNRKLLNP